MSKDLVTLLTLDSVTICQVLAAEIDLAIANARARGEEGVLLKSPGGRKCEAELTEAEAASGELTNTAATICRFFSLRPTVQVGRRR